jgi:outer membrane protein TolC
MRLLIFIIFFFLAVNGFAQERLTRDEAIALALKNNATIKSSAFEVESTQQLRKTSFDLPKTGITVMTGRYNSYADDNSITISQIIPFTVFGSQGALNRSLAASSSLKKAAIENEVVYEVKRVYNRLLFEYSYRTLLLQQDSIFEGFYRSAAARYKSGETQLLEQATADAQRNEGKNRIRLNETEINNLRNHLAVLTNSDFIPELAAGELSELPVTVSLDTSALSGNPSLAYARQQIEISAKEKKLEKAKAAPDLHIGYFNQTLIGTLDPESGDIADKGDRFSGFQIGISVPLWFAPHQARVRASAYRQKEAESNFAVSQLNTRMQRDRALQQLETSRNSLRYYRESALPNADLILKHAHVGFREGDIDYASYLLSLQQAMRIQEGYLQALHDYNQNIIYIEFLSGNK